MRQDFVKYLEQAILTADERSEVYGDAYKKHGDILQTLFPEGVFLKSEKQFNRFCAINASIAKLARYCKNFDIGHKDSAHDLINFAAMLEEFADDTTS